MDRVGCCTLMLVMFSVPVFSGRSCVVDEFTVVNDFQLDQYAGTWYEISWAQYYYEPPYDNYLDFVESYTVINSTFVQADNAGRIKVEDKNCIHHRIHYEVMGNAAKWKRISHVHITDYWIIATDYVSYAFVYGCTKRNPDGTCEFAHAWKWSRSQSLEERHMRIVNEAALSVCMENYTFIASPQSLDCYVSGNQIVAANNLITTLPVVLLVMWSL